MLLIEVITINYYDEIKRELVNNEVYKRVKDYSKNKSDLITYYNVGKLIVEAQGGEKRAKYGDGLIKEYERLDDKTKEKILTNKKNKIEDFLKDPILIKNSSITC